MSREMSPVFEGGQRALLAVVGGYWLTAAVVALSARALASALERSEAVALAAMLGPIVYVVALLWAFAEPRLQRCWWVLGGGPLLAYGVVEILSLMAQGQVGS